MDLFRFYAYPVSPQKGVPQPKDPDGGSVRITAKLKAITADLVRPTPDNSTLVDFNVNTKSRTNDVRDAILGFGFKAASGAGNAALFLARRLGSVMDQRSNPCLLIIAAYRKADTRSIILWTFPRDEAFRLQRGRDGPAIEDLTDIFSKTSNLRKAAQFQGKEGRSAFLNGRALDFQAQDTLRDVADFWISRFLECRLGITGAGGTRVLAQTILKTDQALVTPADKEMLYTAVMAVRNTPRPRISLDTFRHRYLSGTAAAAFVKSVPKAGIASSAFDFQRAVFDATLKFKIFTLDTGVVVSAPLGQVGKSVQLSENGHRKLSCSGLVLEERLRTQHA